MRKSIALSVLGWLLAFGSAQAQVAFDANATAFVSSLGSVSSISTSNLTIGTGANRALVAQLAVTSNIGQSISSCAWDPTGANQALTKIVGASATGGNRAELWGLVNPTSGNKTLTCNFSAPIAGSEINATSFIGVNQAGGATTFYNSNSAIGTTATPGITIASASGDAAIDALMVSAVSNVSPTQTLLYIDNTFLGGGSSWAAGSTSVAFSWPGGGTYSGWIDAATSIKAAPANTNHFLTLMGVGQ